MKGLVISDIHDHIRNLRSVLKNPLSRDCDVMFCCGDLCSPFIIDIIDETWKKPVHIVFGNNDGDRHLIGRKCFVANTRRDPQSPLMVHGEYLFKNASETLTGIPPGVSVSMTHYPAIAEHIKGDGTPDLILYGHSHISNIEISGQVIKVNPGSVMGYIPSRREHSDPSFAVVDFENRNAELHSFTE